MAAISSAKKEEEAMDEAEKPAEEEEEAPDEPEKTVEEQLIEAKAAGSKAVFLHYYEFSVAKHCFWLSEQSEFNNFITAIICLASVLVGIQTYRSMEDNASLAVLDLIILYIFTVEVLVKIAASGVKPWKYFFDRWNQFDFVVVLVCYMPLDASMVTVLRLFRLLRVLKLVKALPELQVLVMGLLNSLSSIFYVALLLMLVFYLYAVLCISLFRDNDPVHFPELQTTLLTLFRMATFEDWTDIMYIQMYGCDEYPFGFRQYLCTNPKGSGWLPAVFFITFVVLSSFVVLNLFIGVITSNMQEARDELKLQKDEANKAAGAEETDTEQLRCQDVANRIAELVDATAEFGKSVDSLQKDVQGISDRFRENKATLKSLRFAAGGAGGEAVA